MPKLLLKVSKDFMAVYDPSVFSRQMSAFLTRKRADYLASSRAAWELLYTLQGPIAYPTRTAPDGNELPLESPADSPAATESLEYGLDADDLQKLRDACSLDAKVAEATGSPVKFQSIADYLKLTLLYPAFAYAPEKA